VHELVNKLDGQAFTTGIESNSKRTRGTALNTDVYSFDEARRLAVIQVRQYQWRNNRFPKIRKDYYLIGTNENGNAFAHPVDSVNRGNATHTDNGGVLKALAQIWQCEPQQLDHIRRNGDVAFIPSTIPPTAIPCADNGVTVAQSHVVSGEKLFRDTDGTYYVLGRAYLKHSKGQHPTVQASGAYRVAIGVRTRNWGFTAPTAD
jgi:hypothetical protein